MAEVAWLKWRFVRRKGPWCCWVRKRERVLLALKRGRVLLADWPVGRLAGWPVGRSAGWPVGRLTNNSNNNNNNNNLYTSTPLYLYTSIPLDLRGLAFHIRQAGFRKAGFTSRPFPFFGPIAISNIPFQALIISCVGDNNYCIQDEKFSVQNENWRKLAATAGRKMDNHNNF